MSAATTEPTVFCPNCKTSFPLTQSLAAPLIEAARLEYQQKLSEQTAAMVKREEAVRVGEEKIAEARDKIDEQIATRLGSARSEIAADEAKKAKLLASADIEQKQKEIDELNEVLTSRNQKLAEAQSEQAALKKQKRELDDQKRELDLTVQNRVNESVEAIRTKAKQASDAEYSLKVTERDQQIDTMRRTIEELRQKSEQGSQQRQGEAQEIELEELLRTRFPQDTIEPVPKGAFGGDVIHHVYGAGGQRAGTILWESKRTRNWSEQWLAKLRNDQREAKADLALLVSQTPRKGLETFDLIEGVWIAEYRCVVPVAIAVRECLIRASAARLVTEGQQTKQEMIYRYLTGAGFRQRLEAIAEKIADMQDDLDKERTSTTRMWAKRQKQIEAIATSTAGLFGDLQGIVGRSLHEIEGLEMPLLDAPEEHAE
jgi:hypothetical protein